MIGIAKPVSCWLKPTVSELAAVSMPMTWPLVLEIGPPESPWMMLASVCSMPVRFSDEPLPSSLAVIERFSPVMLPVTVLIWPVPLALPIATTPSPTLTLVASPTGTVRICEAPTSWITAMSPVLS